MNASIMFSAFGWGLRSRGSSDNLRRLFQPFFLPSSSDTLVNSDVL